MTDAIRPIFDDCITVKTTEAQGVLNKDDIVSYREKGHIVIEPFLPENLSNCSYDVTLGEWYCELRNDLPDTVNPWTDDMWMAPKKAIGEARRYIPIRPRATILAHTNEFIGGRVDINTEMRCRSSVGRSCLAVCKCAGWGDVGYINRWTMEITNFTDRTIILPVGARVAQIIFLKTNELGGEDEYSGSYQQFSSAELEKIQKQWSPDEMLPRLKGKRM